MSIKPSAFRSEPDRAYYPTTDVTVFGSMRNEPGLKQAVEKLYPGDAKAFVVAGTSDAAVQLPGNIEVLPNSLATFRMRPDKDAGHEPG